MKYKVVLVMNREEKKGKITVLNSPTKKFLIINEAKESTPSYYMLKYANKTKK